MLFAMKRNSSYDDSNDEGDLIVYMFSGAR